MKIMEATQVNLTGGEGALTNTKYFRGKQGLDCYLKISEGLNCRYGFNIEGTRVARRIAEETIAMCPEVPMAYLLMGFVHNSEFFLGLGKSPRESIDRGIEMAQRAIAMDDSIANAHGLLSMFYSYKGDHDRAITEAERAVTLEPGGAFAHEAYARGLTWAGRPEEAIPIYQKAIRLNPSGMGGLYLNFGIALRQAGRVEEAASAFEKAIQRAPDNIMAHIGLVITNSFMGREKDARTAAADVLRINPKFSAEYFVKETVPIKDRDRVLNALRKAGLK